jgi:hypothetical protein
MFSAAILPSSGDLRKILTGLKNGGFRRRKKLSYGEVAIDELLLTRSGERILGM